jgi:hypothetical protein
MVYRITLCATALVSCLFLSATATPAQTLNASVSGLANGTNVEPSAAVQKRTEGRSVSGNATRPSPDLIGSALAAGAPGVEGAPGTESGR